MNLMSHYLKSIMCILELLEDGNKTISIHSLHAVLIWTMIIIMNWPKNVFEQQQSLYGKKDADMQWSISSSCSDCFETMCEPFCICCECGMILFTL